MFAIFKSYSLNAELYRYIIWENLSRTRWCDQYPDKPPHIEITESFVATRNTNQHGSDSRPDVWWCGEESPSC